MPVTFAVANKRARSWTAARALSSEELLTASCPRESKSNQKLLESSIPRCDLRQRHLSPSSNGLIWAVFHAYSGHHHLVLRPEDIWFAVLSQISFYINAHAEELHHYFVPHAGRKKLSVAIDAVGSMEDADFGTVASHMIDLVQQKVKKPRLRNWVMPSFTTTTDCDRTVAAILILGSMQQYLSFKMRQCCGIPSVTLLGEREDWVNILLRLDVLSTLGAEPHTFANLLRPILRNFVSSFDSPDSASTRAFWGKVVHRNAMKSGQDYLSGWITAFAFWNENGKASRISASDEGRHGCRLENVRYPCIDTDSVPAGFASVPVTIDNNGRICEIKLLAGSIGIEAKRSDGKVMDEESSTIMDQSVPDKGGRRETVDSLVHYSTGVVL